ncbi:MAG TPA: ROK family protein [Candidatus Kapabacteria bacterium]|nr:ROK family protein [Candidatus Kapabacteria bacterium]
MQHILAVDIGGTKIAVGIAERSVFAERGTLARIVTERVPAPGTPAAVVPRVIAIARELLGALSDPDPLLSGIGIAIGGPLDHRAGVVINFPHLPEWKNVPLRAMLSEALGAPALLDNDANLGALGEHAWGAGRGVEDMVYMTISTGIGGGVIVGGRLLHGVGSAAGEVGHITVQTGGPRCPCGNAGCLEMMASGTAIARRARQAVAESPDAGARILQQAGGEALGIRAEGVWAAALEGDGLAIRLWEETAEYLAIGLAAIVHVLAPRVMVLGGGVAQTDERFLEAVRSRMRDHVGYVPLERISVVRSALGSNSPLIGAAVLGLEAAGDQH